MAEGKKVLIADDDLILRQMYGERLQTEGFEVVYAGDGDEAVKVAKDAKPDVILLDIMMPKMNGIDALKAMREDGETKGIPVVVLTALLQQVEQIKKIIGPKDSYLTKSETMPNEVVEKIRAALA